MEPFLSLQPRHVALQAWGLAESSLLLLLEGSFLLISSSCLPEPSFPSSWLTPSLYMEPSPLLAFWTLGYLKMPYFSCSDQKTV